MLLVSSLKSLASSATGGASGFSPGDFVNVEITGVNEYDLIGEAL